MLITDDISLIYAGGTFGCHGSPLIPIKSEVFFSTLLPALTQYETNKFNIVNNAVIKDSSQFDINDFLYFYQLILKQCEQGYTKIILITGTDTLSYLSVFLSHMFAGLDINIVITASMKPLYEPMNDKDYVIDANSDAWDNLQLAIDICKKSSVGVAVAFNQQCFEALSVQKIHSQDKNAFTGKPININEIEFYPNDKLDTSRTWIQNRLSLLPNMLNKADTIDIQTLFFLPSNHASICATLKYMISQNRPISVILIGYGSGNIPYSDELASLLDIAYKKGHTMVVTTQCAYGGVSKEYAAGSWQYEHKVLSGNELTVAAIYAKLVYLNLLYDDVKLIHQYWNK